jgi:hypothetical protein
LGVPSAVPQMPGGFPGVVRRRCGGSGAGLAGNRPAEVITTQGGANRPDARRHGRSRRSLISPSGLLGVAPGHPKIVSMVFGADGGHQDADVLGGDVREAAGAGEEEHLGRQGGSDDDRRQDILSVELHAAILSG